MEKPIILLLIPVVIALGSVVLGELPGWVKRQRRNRQRDPLGTLRRDTRRIKRIEVETERAMRRIERIVRNR